MKLSLFLLLISLYSCAEVEVLNKNFKVVAHRGASGYLPEHSLPGVAMAHAWGVDYIEADLVLTRDNHLVVLHDHHVDTTTNVADLFPSRKREDGRFYAIDFDLKELKSLSLRERFDPTNGQLVYSERFGKKRFDFKIPTFKEYIELILELNRITGSKVRMYVELKGFTFHKNAGKDILRHFVETLREYKLDVDDMVIVQSFHPEPLIQLKDKYHNKLTRVQLIAEDDWNETEVKYYKMKTPQGIKQVAEYADAIGPWLGQIRKNPEMIKFAKHHGLKVHAYTHRKESVRKLGKTDAEFIRFLADDLKLDGIFSDQADEVLRILGRLPKR